MKPKRLRGGVTMVFGAFFTIAALGLLVMGVNAAAYLMGAGEEVTVTITEDSFESGNSSMDENGYGYYERDGERVEVTSSHVAKGEEITTRLPLIPFSWGDIEPIHANDHAAWSDMTCFIGVVLLGGAGFVMLLGGWIMATKGTGPRRLRRAFR